MGSSVHNSAERWPHQCTVKAITIAGIWESSFKNERDKKSETTLSSNDFYLWDFHVEGVKIMKSLMSN